MKVAILIPTMARPDFIERTVHYYHLSECTHPIYIGDASNKDGASRITAFLNRYPKLDIHYFHWEGLGVIETIVRLAEEAVTDCSYCAFQGDDDYFVPASLTMCAQFLSKDYSYRTAQGKAALFMLDRPGAYGNLRSVADYWGINELELDSGEARFRYFAQHYFVTQFSVHRTVEFLDDSVHFQAFRDSVLSELLHCFTFAIMGKSKFLDCLFLVRNSHDGRAEFYLSDRVKLQHFAPDYKLMIDALTNALHKSDGMPHHLGRQLVSDVMKRRVESVNTKPPINRRANVFVRARRALPVRVKSFLWAIILDTRDLRLLVSQKSHYFDDFQPILQSIRR